MGVSKNRGTPQIIHFNRGFHYKPSILEYHCFGKHPYNQPFINALLFFRATSQYDHSKNSDTNLHG